MSKNRLGDASPIDPDSRKAMVNDALKGFMAKESTQKNTPHQQVVNRAMLTSKGIYDCVVEVLKADKLKGGAFDANACYSLIEKLHMDNFSQWSKDDLLFIFTVLCTEVMVEKAQTWHDNADPNKLS